MSDQARCMYCGCTEENPCRLEADECMLSVVTLRCTNPRCVLAAVEAVRRDAAARKRETKRLVTPIAQAWLRERLERRQKRQGKSRKATRKTR